MALFTIARLTFREASRRWVLWAALIMGIVFLVVYFFGFRAVYIDIQRNIGMGAGNVYRGEILNFLSLAGLYVVNFLAVVMGVLTSIDTLSGEIGSGTIHTLVSKPIRRWEVVGGKWLGFMVMLTLYIALMGGGVLAIVGLVSGYVPPNPLRGLALIWLNMALVLSVSLAGGAVLSTLANGVLVFGMYGVAFIGGWIEQIGAMLKNQTAINVGIISGLIIPSEALWKRAAYEMQSPLVGMFGVSPFVSNTVPSPLMLGYAMLYTLAAIALAIYLFSKRDL